MTKLLLILFISILFSGELEVDGDLKVTGTIQNDSLAQVINLQQQQILTLEGLIVQLQAQIALLESQMAFLGQDLNNADCFGVVGGSAVIDDCGICDGNNESMDVCGDCGGDITDIEYCTYALSFDGNDDYVEIPEINAGAYYHLESKVKLVDLNSGSDFYTIIAHPTINELGVTPADNSIQFHKSGGQGYFSGGSLSYDIWSTIKLTRNNDEYKLYLDNSLTYSNNHNFSDDIYNTIGSWQPGHTDIGAREPWQGEIESIIIYNGADTLANYKYNYNSESDILYDHSGNGNHGTIHGASWVQINP